MLVEKMLHNYIGGTWEAARATESIAVSHPATGEVIAHGPVASPVTERANAVTSPRAAPPRVTA